MEVSAAAKVSVAAREVAVAARDVAVAATEVAVVAEDCCVLTAVTLEDEEEELLLQVLTVWQTST